MHIAHASWGATLTFVLVRPLSPELLDLEEGVRVQHLRAVEAGQIDLAIDGDARIGRERDHVAQRRASDEAARVDHLPARRDAPRAAAQHGLTVDGDPYWGCARHEDGARDHVHAALQHLDVGAVGDPAEDVGPWFHGSSGGCARPLAARSLPRVQVQRPCGVPKPGYIEGSRWI